MNHTGENGFIFFVVPDFPFRPVLFFSPLAGEESFSFILSSEQREREEPT